MKPGRPTQLEQEQGPSSASALGRRARQAQNAESPLNRQPFAGGVTPASGWRLPSGQLLVEYALQTCFTGSPLARPAFSSAGKVQEGADAAALETQQDLSQQLTSLHGALGGSPADPPQKRGKRAATLSAAGKRSRSESGAKDPGFKERSRS
ncbi:MAG: hypothetical protein IPJ98_21705 [Bryobacterales bacterium]|nr:hypothetical protein [Bryobacterales bacterium]